MTNFMDQLKDKYVHRNPLKYFADLGIINLLLKCHLEKNIKKLIDTQKNSSC